MQWNIQIDNTNHGVIKVVTSPDKEVFLDSNLVGISNELGELILDLPLRGFYTLSTNEESTKVYMPKGLSRNRRRLTSSIANNEKRIISAVKSVPYGLDESVLVIIERKILFNKTGGIITTSSGFNISIQAGIIDGISFVLTNLTLPADKISLIYVDENGQVLFSDYRSDIIEQYYPLGVVSTTNIAVGNILNFIDSGSYISCIKSDIFEEDLTVGNIEKLLALGSLYNCFTDETNFYILTNIDGESIEFSYPLSNYGSWQLYSKQTFVSGQANSGMLTDGHMPYNISLLDITGQSNIFNNPPVNAGNYSFYSKTTYNTTWSTSSMFRMPSFYTTAMPQLTFTPQEYIIKNGYDTILNIPYSSGSKVTLNSIPNPELGVWFLHSGVISDYSTQVNYIANYFDGVKYQSTELDSQVLSLGETGGKLIAGKDEFELYYQTKSNSNDLSNFTDILTKYDFYADTFNSILYQNTAESSSNDLINLIDNMVQYDFYTDTVIQPQLILSITSASNDLIIN